MAVLLGSANLQYVPPRRSGSFIGWDYCLEAGHQSISGQALRSQGLPALKSKSSEEVKLALERFLSEYKQYLPTDSKPVTWHTDCGSTKTHMEHDAVDFNMVKSFGIFILIGVIAGTFLAVNLKTPALVLFFSIFAFLVGVFFIFLREKLVENPKKISDLIKNISGIVIGFISVPLGIGGGSLMVPFMRTFGYDIRKSIGTAAAVGFLIAVTGTTTMIISGKIIDNINTPFSLGYINLLGFAVFVPVTMLMARVGAKAVYKINKGLLSKIFGSFLIIVSIRSFFEYLSIN